MNAPRVNINDNTFPLSEAEVDKPVRLVRACCGRGLAAHLAAMGLRPGAKLTVIRGIGPGPMIIGLGDNRMALGRGMAHKMLVTRVDGKEKAGRAAAEE